MSNSNSEVYDSSSNVGGRESQEKSIESSEPTKRLDAQPEDTKERSQMIYDTSRSPPSSNNTSSHSTPVTNGPSTYSASRENSNRGRVKSSNSRRGDHPSGTPPHYDPRDRYKPSYGQSRGDGSGGGPNKGHQQYSQKPRSRSNDLGPYGQPSGMYSPSSPQHSLSHSGSVTPTSIPASPIGSFPQTPVLPEGLTQLPYGQIPTHYSPVINGIATIPRSVESPGYYVNQSPQQMDQRFQQQMVLPNGQQIMNSGMIQYVNVIPAQASPPSPQHHVQSSPSKPNHIQVLHSGQVVGMIPAGMQGGMHMPPQQMQGQPYYPQQMPMHPQQDMRGIQQIQMPQPGLMQQTQMHAAMQYGQHVAPMGYFVPQGQPIPLKQGYQNKMNPPPNYFMVPQHAMQPQQPAHQPQMQVPQMMNSNHPPVNQEPPKSRPKFVIKDKNGNVFENLKDYASESKKPNADELNETEKLPQQFDQSVHVDTSDVINPSTPSIPNEISKNEVLSTPPAVEVNQTHATLSSIPVFIQTPSTTSTPPSAAKTTPTDSSSWRSAPDNSMQKKVNATPEPSKPHATPESKSKRAVWKEKVAVADANAKRGDNMLDAYTTVEISKPSPSVVESQVDVAINPEPASVPQVVPTPVQEEAEDWEVTADKIASGEKVVNFPEQINAQPSAEKETPARVSRSLRPQGNSKLNTGPTNRPPPVRLTYSREYILKQRTILFASEPPPELPPVLAIYNNLSNDLLSSPTTSSAPSNPPNQSSASKGSGGGRGSGSLSRNSSQEFHQMKTDNVGADIIAEGSWKRDSAGSSTAPLAKQPSQNNRGPRDRMPAPLPPKKSAVDPLENLTLQVRSILNKITPQTFEKLAGQIRELKITSSLYCDRLVSLIFEKAIFEQNFSNLYAELCLDLEKDMLTWPFIHVIYFRDSNQYSWVIDIDMESNVLSGPYKSTKDCVNASNNDVLPPMRPISQKLVLHQIVASNNVLTKIYRNPSSVAEEYFCGFLSLSEIPPESMSNIRYTSADDANRSARKKNTIKSRLLRFCEQEFYQSSEKSDKYEEVEIAKMELEKNKRNMTHEEISYAKQRIEELEDKLKRRVLGTIRFIGELFKKGLANTPVVLECMTKLLCDSTTANGAPKDFKPFPPDLDLEVLCKLVRTVGKEFEFQTQKSGSTEKAEIFNQCLKRMHELSMDRKRIARIRFSLEEVIQMRENNWIERRVEEGPMKIEEMHRLIEEENRKSGIVNLTYSGLSTTKNTGGPSRDSFGTGKTAPVDSSRGRVTDKNIKPSDTARTGKGPSDPSYVKSKSVDDARSNIRDSDNVPSSRMSEMDNLQLTLDDYVRSNSESEVIEVLTDKNASALAIFVSMAMKKYVTMPQSQSSVRNLFTKIAPYLAKAKSEIATEISKFESLRLLSDFVLDLRQAPEYFGQFFAILISQNILEMSWLVEFTRSVFEENKEIASEEDINAVFSRLLNAATARY